MSLKRGLYEEIINQDTQMIETMETVWLSTLWSRAHQTNLSLHHLSLQPGRKRVESDRPSVFLANLVQVVLLHVKKKWLIEKWEAEGKCFG